MTSFPAGHVLTASELNAAVDAPFVTGLGAWQPYTPAWTSTGTQPVLGNGTINGAYMKIGRGVLYRIQMVTGSTTTYGTGTYLWSLPVTCNTTAAQSPVGRCSIIDVSAALRFNRDMQPFSTGTVTAVSEAGVLVTPSAPMTWANGDSIAVMGFYESAA